MQVINDRREELLAFLITLTQRSRRDIGRVLPSISWADTTGITVLLGRHDAGKSNSDIQRGVMALHFLDALMRAKRPRLPRSAGRGRHRRIASPEDVIIGGRKFTVAVLGLAPFLFRTMNNSRIPIYYAAPVERKRVLRAMRDAISCNEDTTCERVRARASS